LEANHLKLEVAESVLSSHTIAVAFPLTYLKQIIFKELKENLRHADQTQAVKFEWRDDDSGMLTLIVSNTVLSTPVATGGGKGLARLNKLNDFPFKMIFKAERIGAIYSQHITFTKL
jgi:hypothetical protein